MAEQRKAMIDNLFDAHFTPLDFIKIIMLVVTLFSTWYIIDLMTPDVTFAFVRELGAVIVVEGAFLGFEYAAHKSKNKTQTNYALTGSFASLGVIIIFAFVSGFLEFAGTEILSTTLGTWAGIVWKVEDFIKVFALVTTVSWFAALAILYRLYDQADPDKQAELTKIQLEGDVTMKANDALQKALGKAAPVIAIQRALDTVRKSYEGELSPDQLSVLLKKVEAHLSATLLTEDDRETISENLPLDPSAPLLDQVLNLHQPVSKYEAAQPGQVIFERTQSNPNGHRPQNPT